MTLTERRELLDSSLVRPDGTPLATADLPRPLVLFFFPRADTPGCTQEARDFNDLQANFAAAGIALVGISRDPPAKLARFAAKHGLTVPLASDPGALTDALGLWGEKTLYGRAYMGLERATLLVGTDGCVTRVWRRVKVKNHAVTVLAETRDLIG